MPTHTVMQVNDDLYAKRYNANGIMVWQNTLVISEAEGSQSDIRMSALSDCSFFVFTLVDKRNADPDIYAQKINLVGDLLWGNYLIVYSDQYGLRQTSNKSSYCRHPDNGVIIVWEDFRFDTQNAGSFLEKNFLPVSNNGGEEGIVLCTAEFAQIRSPRFSH